MFIDPFDQEDLKFSINKNIKRIEEISKERDAVEMNSESWFEAWNLIKVTAELIEKLGEESRQIECKMEN